MTKSFFSFFSKQMPEDAKNILEAAKAVFADFGRAVLIFDGAKKIIFANSSALELLGYGADEIEDVSPSKLSFKKHSLSAGSNFSQKITDKTGKKFPARISVSAVRGTEFLSAVIETGTEDGVLRDNTAAVLEDSPFGVCVRDKDGAVILWNAAAERITALKFDDLRGKTLQPFIEDENFRRELEAADKKLSKTGGSAYMQNVKCAFPPGEQYLNIFKSYKPLDGGSALFIDIFEDVTALMRENIKSVQIQTFLQAIIGNLPLALYARDKYGRYLINNKKSLEYFGGGVLTQLEENIMSLYDKEVSEDAWRQNNPKHETEEQIRGYLSREQEVLRSGKIMDIPLEEYDRGSGKSLVHLVKAPVFDAGGRAVAVLTIAEDISEKVKKEREILETRNFLQAVLDNAPIAIYARDVNGKILFSNKESDGLFEIENLVPKHQGDKEDDTFLHARENRIFTDKKIMEIPEEIYHSSSGQEYILHLVKAPVFDEHGNPFMVLTIAEDVTDKRRHEEDISKAKNFLQRVVDNLPVALLAKKYTGEYILWNKKSEELFGARADHVIGKQFYQSDLNPDLQTYIKQQDKTVFESGREMDVPQEIISTVKDGVKIMHTVKTPVFDERGNPDYLISVSEDITLKSKMERQLKESREKYSLLVENSGEGVVIVEGKKIIFANAKFAAMAGAANVESVANADIFNFISAENKAAFEEVYDGALAAARPVSGEIKMLRETGEEMDLEAVAVASKYMGKKIVLMFFRDVTDRNKLIEGLRADREYFKNSFEFFPTPLALLTPAGYVSLLNAAARKVLELKTEDRSVYRTYYLKPQLPLDVRQKMSRGETAEFDFTFNPADIDQRIFKTALVNPLDFKLKLVPVSKRDNKDGSVSAEYLAVMEERVLPKTQIEAEDILLFPAPALKCGNDGKIISVNTSFAALNLPAKARKKGAAFTDLFAQEDRYAVTRDLEELFKQGFVYDRFYKINTLSGEMPVSLDAARARDGFIALFRNTTAQNQFSALLRERGELYDAALKSCGGAVLFCEEAASDIPGKIIFANGAAQTVLGAAASDIVGAAAEDFLTPPSGKPDKARGLIDGAVRELASKNAAFFMSKIYPKEGEAFDAEIILSAFETGGRRVFVFIMRALNELVNAAKADNGAGADFDSIRNFLGGVLFKVDADGVVMEGFTNSRRRGGFYNISRHQFKSPYDYLPKDAADTFVYSVKEALSVGTATSFDFSLNGDDGVKAYEARVSPVSGGQTAFVLIREVVPPEITNPAITMPAAPPAPGTTARKKPKRK